MRLDDFTDGQRQHLVRALNGYWAFVPPPLPPRIDLSWSLVASLSDADRALARLAGVGRTLPNPHLLIPPFIRREAVLSSRIEGTEASLSDLFYFEGAGGMPERGSGSRDVPEVLNYVHALEYGLNRLREMPITLRLLREVHERLLHGARGGDKRPGEFRQDQNWIGRPGSRLEEATYVPPPVAEMTTALYALETFVNLEKSLPLLIRLALIHYQFEAIHPFRDGNGRIGRLLMTLMLCAEDALPAPLLYLSAFFEPNREDYYRLLLGVSQKGSWDDWIRFFLNGVTAQAADGVRRADDLLTCRETYRSRLQSGRTPGAALRLLDELFVAPVITGPTAAKVLQVTPRAAQQSIERLIEVGLLHEVTGRQRNRVYVAQLVLDILSAP